MFVYDLGRLSRELLSLKFQIKELSEEKETLLSHEKATAARNLQLETKISNLEKEMVMLQMQNHARFR